jgi:hypothetical protein
MRANLVASRCESRRQCAACGPNQCRSRAQFCSGLVSGLDKVDVSLVKERVLHCRSCGACVAGHGAWARWQGGGRNGVPRVRVGSVVGCGLDSNAVHVSALCHTHEWVPSAVVFWTRGCTVTSCRPNAQQAIATVYENHTRTRALSSVLSRSAVLWTLRMQGPFYTGVDFRVDPGPRVRESGLVSHTLETSQDVASFPRDDLCPVGAVRVDHRGPRCRPRKW